MKLFIMSSEYWVVVFCDKCKEDYHKKYDIEDYEFVFHEGTEVQDGNIVGGYTVKGCTRCQKPECKALTMGHRLKEETKRKDK